MNEGMGRVLFLAYDLDRFAVLIDDSRLRRFYDMGADALEAARKDNEALLLLAFKYIRAQLDELYKVV